MPYWRHLVYAVQLFISLTKLLGPHRLSSTCESALYIYIYRICRWCFLQRSKTPKKCEAPAIELLECRIPFRGHYSKCTLTQGGSIYSGPIYESNRFVWKWFVLDRNTWYLTTVWKQIIIIIILLIWEFFPPALADCLPLEFEWQHVSSSLQDSSQYSGRSQQCCSVDRFLSSSYFQILQSNPLVTVPSALITISIIVTVIFDSFSVL